MKRLKRRGKGETYLRSQDLLVLLVARLEKRHLLGGAPEQRMLNALCGRESRGRIEHNSLSNKQLGKRLIELSPREAATLPRLQILFATCSEAIVAVGKQKRGDETQSKDVARLVVERRRHQRPALGAVATTHRRVVQRVRTQIRGNAKVNQLANAVLVQQNVGGLHVAMRIVELGVNVLQPVRNLLDERKFAAAHSLIHAHLIQSKSLEHRQSDL